MIRQTYMITHFSETKSMRRLVLKSNVSSNQDVPIKGIIFDMDGTLTKPQTWMFGEMRYQLQVPDGVDILTHLDSLPTAEDRHNAEMKLRKIEEKAMNEQEPTVGLISLFEKLHDLGIKTSICTRNVPKPVTDFCSKFLRCDPFIFNEKNLVKGPVVTREFKPPKPSPQPLLHIMKDWQLQPHEVIMVGDSHDDMLAGLNAGCAVVLLRHQDNEPVEKFYPDLETGFELNGVVPDLNALFTLLENGIELKGQDKTF